MDKQRSTKHTHKTKDRVARIPLKPWGELWCSGRVTRSNTDVILNLVSSRVYGYLEVSVWKTQLLGYFG
jgi:hypothetical protein